MSEKITLLHNVINNIISNAIKFSYPNSKIKISQKSDKNHKALTIRDFGVGIGPAHLNKIQDRKDVLSTMGTEGEPGTGYGMSLMHAYMDLYAGKIEINSWTEQKEGQQTGTEITLYFPKR